MKKRRIWLLAILSSVTLAISACGGGSSESEVTTEPEVVEESNESEEDIQEESDIQQEGQQEENQIDVPEDLEDSEPEKDTSEPPQLSESNFSIIDVGSYAGQPYSVVNDNQPYFSENDLTANSFEYYSDLDNLGRCGVAYASIGIDLMPTEDRESISEVKPSGWINEKYDIVDGGYLYNRCHLIGFQLSGENANKKNLITGTRYLNVDGMLPYENMIADYVKETENHVMYRVTPVYEGDNLVASGVLMEARSVEDQGEDIEFCVYCYNVQPGIIINYATGESSLEETESESESKTTAQEEIPAPQVQAEEPEPEPEAIQEPEPQGTDYILNTNTHKFHYPNCSSVGQMKESNKEFFTGSRDDVIARGYDPCKRCNP